MESSEVSPGGFSSTSAKEVELDKENLAQELPLVMLGTMKRVGLIETKTKTGNHRFSAPYVYELFILYYI